MADPFEVSLPGIGQAPWNLNPALEEVRDRIGSVEDITPGSSFETKLSTAVGDAISEVVLDAANFGAGRTHVEINAAIAALPAQGGRVVIRAKDGPWSIGRRVSNDSSAGGIYINRSNVTLECDDTVFNLTASCDFVKIRGEGGFMSTVTADVVATDTTLTVADSSGFAVGQDVFCRLGASQYDAFEPSYWLFAKVAAVPDGTHVTIDRPAGQSLAVAGVTNVALKSVQVLNTFPQNVNLRGTWRLNNSATGGANAEAGIYAQIAKNISIDKVIASNPGAGAVILQYVDGAEVGIVKVTNSVAQGGQTSKGRGVNIAESRGVHFGVVEVENFERIPIWTEARTEGVVIDHVLLHNTHATRDNATIPLVATIGEASLRIGSMSVFGKTSYVWGTGGSPGNHLSIEDAFFYTNARPIMQDLRPITGQLYVDQKRYTTLRRFRKVLPLTPGRTGAAAFTSIPSGIYRELTIYCSTTTGIDYFALNSAAGSSANVVAGLVSGGSYTSGVGSGIGNGYPFNNAPTSKAVILGTSSSLPAGAYVVIEGDYFADPATANTDAPLDQGIAPNPGREVLYAPSAPTTGFHFAGSICWNSAPTAGGIAGWMCVADGTPGTWKAMAALAS